MYAGNTVPTAVAQLTGEQLQSARLRTATLNNWETLVPAAESQQALLESLLLGALGASADRKYPFGVHSAVPTAEQLELYLEDDSCAELLLELLPYRNRRGTWRGVRRLGVHTERGALHFTLPPYRSHRYGSATQRPLVIVHAQRETGLSLLLDRHRQRLEKAGGHPQWDREALQSVHNRREPLSRNVLEQHAAACQLASALLRRPRMWDALSGHMGVTASPTLADHGLDWTVERTVAAGTHLHDDRLPSVLTDRIVGPGLRLLRHTCSAEVCTGQWVSAKRQSGWDGLLTVHTRSVARPGGRSPRPLLVLGDSLVPSRPHRAASTREEHHQRPYGQVIGLISLEHAPNRVDPIELHAVATEMGAVWALQGYRVAVLVIRADERPMLLGHSGRPRWATKDLPWAAPKWTRLRINPSPGQLWGGTLPLKAENLTDDLARARRHFQRIIVVDNSNWSMLLDFAPTAVDTAVLALAESAYERQLARPSGPRTSPSAPALALSPLESAVKWRERELGQRSLRHVPLAGILLLHDLREQAPIPDAFTRQVEKQLDRYGTPILGRYPRLGLSNLAQHSGATTVLDPISAEQHDSMIHAATSLAAHLWPDSPPLRSSAGATPRTPS
ncbi:hypothetical protein [Streptomyces nodosus]|uniref:hypothetical protein n=1 Tax=Streptomyces nodosus TaxID=40318 RepID=UPI0038117146